MQLCLDYLKARVFVACACDCFFNTVTLRESAHLKQNMLEIKLVLSDGDHAFVGGKIVVNKFYDKKNHLLCPGVEARFGDADSSEEENKHPDGRASKCLIQDGQHP